MVTLITCLPARSPREPLQQALRTRARRARTSPLLPASPRPSPTRRTRVRPWGSGSSLTPRPAPRAPPPARAAVSGARGPASPCARCQQSLARGPSPPPPIPPDPHPSAGWGPHLGPPLVSAPRRPPRPRRDRPAGPAWLRTSPFHLEATPQRPHSLSLAKAPEGGGSPESWSVPLQSSSDRGHLWVSRPGWALCVLHLGSCSHPVTLCHRNTGGD